ncbi:sulfite exporter TauE/SafE family protein [Mycobacterium sp. 21AC1]|uniref:sulfite exporter TauE/SafE family protein n=1 Tax=[Mycobacterium] appelbergii TaxID=2939269 RepID=UPI002938D2A7|nr:sulfite exporter TauE/SafE family protein [Mycobacterium sp. 21AC1]MDV3127911.1 sulfite exporter TauE/SafE family protein [Mycobacterium sp. 21AC1]
MSPGQIALLAVAGVLAGSVNTAAGGGTLISFPALLALGVPPVTANITSAIGLVPGYAGGAYAYRRELHGQRRRFVGLLAVSILGGIVGALLLLATPGNAFKRAVPYLVIISCLLLLAQPRLAAWVNNRRRQEATTTRNEISRFGIQSGGLLASVYGSYFGAGLGVLLLAVLGIFISDDMQRLNALKALLSLVIVTAGATVYIGLGQVSLLQVAILCATSCIGGFLGGFAARRLSPETLRRAVCVLGFTVAAVMLKQG